MKHHFCVEVGLIKINQERAGDRLHAMDKKKLNVRIEITQTVSRR